MRAVFTSHLTPSSVPSLCGNTCQAWLPLPEVKHMSCLSLVYPPTVPPPPSPLAPWHQTPLPFFEIGVYPVQSLLRCLLGSSPSARASLPSDDLFRAALNSSVPAGPEDMVSTKVHEL